MHYLVALLQRVCHHLCDTEHVAEVWYVLTVQVLDNLR